MTVEDKEYTREQRLRYFTNQNIITENISNDINNTTFFKNYTNKIIAAVSIPLIHVWKYTSPVMNVVSSIMNNTKIRPVLYIICLYLLIQSLIYTYEYITLNRKQADTDEHSDKANRMKKLEKLITLLNVINWAYLILTKLIPISEQPKYTVLIFELGVKIFTVINSSALLLMIGCFLFKKVKTKLIH